jgi:hypothetical protein
MPSHILAKELSDALDQSKSKQSRKADTDHRRIGLETGNTPQSVSGRPNSPAEPQLLALRPAENPRPLWAYVLPTAFLVLRKYRRAQYHQVMSAARRHHWIPESYLGLFSREGETGSQVFVIDCVQRKSFWTSTDNVCVKRDFNRIESPDLDRNELEKRLGRFESDAISALREIGLAHQAPIKPPRSSARRILSPERARSSPTTTM